MSKVIWHVTMSLDGFIAGPGDAMDWVFEHESAPSALAGETLEETGTILAGRRWWDVAVERYRGRAGIYGGAWDGPLFVLTHRPADPPTDPAVTFLSDGVADAVATARAAAGDRSLGIFGANLARQCLAAGLLDELVVHLVPVLLGDGVRLYGDPAAPKVRLERTLLAESGQLTDLRLRVARD